MGDPPAQGPLPAVRKDGVEYVAIDALCLLLLDVAAMLRGEGREDAADAVRVSLSLQHGQSIET